MRDHWITSDTHFFHEGILRYEGGRQEFASLDEMHECIVERWNSVVKPGDRVYHLGDVTMAQTDDFKELWSRLNGGKRLVVGNHDDIKWLSRGGFFGGVYAWRKRTDLDMIFSHVPVARSSLRGGEGYMLNVHGHTHRNHVPHVGYYNVCVERHEYTPVHVDELLQYYRLNRDEIKCTGHET